MNDYFISCYSSEKQSYHRECMQKVHSSEHNDLRNLIMKIWRRFLGYKFHGIVSDFLPLSLILAFTSTEIISSSY